MAASEARAAWQRSANRCFVQEDAKRAPKLACSQSNSRSKQADIGHTGAVDGSDDPGLGFMPFIMNPSYFNLPVDAKWWLQLDPNYDYLKGFSCGQLKVPLEADVETAGVGNVKPASKGEEFKSLDEKVEDSDSVSRTGLEKDGDVNFKNDPDVLDVKDLTDYYELMEMELVGGSASKQSSDLSCVDSTWTDSEKVPWWRKTNKDDLASFVAEKSLDHIENCDLPPKHHRTELSSESTHFETDEMYLPLQDWTQSDATLCSRAGETRNTSASVDANLSEGISNAHLSDDIAKAQLLQALCHSQTRAREAEKAARQAHAEKEHIVKLFFKQASQLFAYKQWLRILQLEYFYLQLNNSNQAPMPSTLVPDVLMPFSPCTPNDPHGIWKKTAKARRHKRRGPGCEICKCAVAFALGLSLVGTGLLLGWTVGWLLPF